MAESQKVENISNDSSDGGAVKAEATELAVKTEPPTTPKQEKTSAKKREATDKDDTANAKKKRSPPKANKTNVEAGEDGGEEVVTPQTPRKRKASGTPSTPGRSIPANLDEADEADRMLLRMKDEGSSWPEIRAAWKDLTGETNIGTSTLPNRYNRLKANFVQFTKANFVQFTKEDVERLQAAKIDVEMKFNDEKWAKIAEAMEAMGSQKFSTAIIQKKIKELEKKAVVNDIVDGEED